MAETRNPRGKKKAAEADAQLNLLPMMNLFSILIPYLLMCASFSSIKIIGMDLPETQMAVSQSQAKDVDDNGLLLTIFITDKGLTLGARGGMLPTTFVREVHKYVYHYPKGSEEQFEYFCPITKSTKKDLPICPKDPSRRLTLFERQEIILYALNKVSESDTGTLIGAVYNENEECVTNSNGQILANIPKPGDTVYTLAADRKMAIVKQEDKYSARNLSVYDELGARLLRLRSKYSTAPDIEEIKIVAENDVVFDKMVHIMDICRQVGFPKIALAKMAG